MRKILMITIFFAAIYCKEKHKAQDNIASNMMYVSPKTGLILRALPDRTSKNLILLPQNSEIEILDRNGPSAKIDGIDGNWFKVRNKGLDGWMFGPYLKQSLNSQDSATTDYTGNAKLLQSQEFILFAKIISSICPNKKKFFYFSLGHACETKEEFENGEGGDTWKTKSVAVYVPATESSAPQLILGTDDAYPRYQGLIENVQKKGEHTFEITMTSVNAGMNSEYITIKLLLNPAMDYLEGPGPFQNSKVTRYYKSK